MMQRTKHSNGRSKNIRRAELLLLEAQRDILDLRIRELETYPNRNLKRDLPPDRKGTASKRLKQDGAAMSLEDMFNQCRKLLSQLKNNNNSGPFQNPVDPVLYNCPDYFKIIKHPMDFKTIAGKLRPAKRVYKSPLEFRDDVRLVFKNCRDYNPAENPIRIMGDRLSDYFENLWVKYGLEKVYSRRQDVLKKERNGEDDKRKLKKQKPQNLERYIKKLADIRRRMKEILAKVDSTASTSQSAFWQKRKLSEALEGADLNALSRLMDHLQPSAGKETLLDDLASELVTRIQNSVSSSGDTKSVDKAAEEQAVNEEGPVGSDTAETVPQKSGAGTASNRDARVDKPNTDITDTKQGSQSTQHLPSEHTSNTTTQLIDTAQHSLTRPKSPRLQDEGETKDTPMGIPEECQAQQADVTGKSDPGEDRMEEETK